MGVSLFEGDFVVSKGRPFEGLLKKTHSGRKASSSLGSPQCHLPKEGVLCPFYACVVRVGKAM